MAFALGAPNPGLSALRSFNRNQNMQQSSDSIGAIASALAKAQSELTNPEKSLVATIRSPFPREGEKTFRYAPLSTGLDIVRKALGKYEIAIVQTTGIDRDAGLVHLRTVLAHSSAGMISGYLLDRLTAGLRAPGELGCQLPCIWSFQVCVSKNLYCVCVCRLSEEAAGLRHNPQWLRRQQPKLSVGDVLDKAVQVAIW